MRLTRITPLETYFLVRLVDAVLASHGEALTPHMVPARGELWRTSISATGHAYRAAVEALIAAKSKAEMAATAHHGLAARMLVWRRYMEGVAGMEQDPQLRQALLKAVGHGLGSPRNRPPVRAFLDHISAATAANADTLRKLGATEESIQFATTARAQEAAAWTELLQHKAAVAKARSDQKVLLNQALAALKDVSLAATTAVRGAQFTGNASELQRAEEVVTRLDAAVEQARKKER